MRQLTRLDLTSLCNMIAYVFNFFFIIIDRSNRRFVFLRALYELMALYVTIVTGINKFGIICYHCYYESIRLILHVILLLGVNKTGIVCHLVTGSQ